MNSSEFGVYVVFRFKELTTKALQKKSYKHSLEGFLSFKKWPHKLRHFVVSVLSMLDIWCLKRHGLQSIWYLCGIQVKGVTINPLNLDLFCHKKLVLLKNPNVDPSPVRRWKHQQWDFDETSYVAL